ncbi:hypothetical protein IGI04_024438 [Brassica rapa subsp. trilocularis]|uniref:Uncharacterized protein n=1 Tax=Brassica rapa subsp. trilocularis TaxID=1813537 RepID=A0ABQ7M815_BRACM|nr:hypothetical protein IGI04_024438 [Brassica rapa subsp. trilocularis]
MKQVASCLLSAKLCYELNPQVKQPQLVFNPPPAASHVLKPTEKPREFQREREKEEQKNQPVCCFEKDQKLQAYHGEEDQLRPSSPLVHLGPFSFVQEELKSCPSQFQDCSLGESRQMLR